MKKIYKKLLKYIFGDCYVDGHKWKMQHDGWQLNPDWIPEEHGFHNPKFPMTRKWIYYRCKKCRAVAE